MLIAVRKIERNGQLESARRALQLAGAAFRYTVATVRLASDPTRGLRGALAAPTVTRDGAIERALAHGESDRVRAAFHRGAHWKERVAMAQWWSDHLGQLRREAEAVPIKAGNRFASVSGMEWGRNGPTGSCDRLVIGCISERAAQIHWHDVTAVRYVPSDRDR